MKNINLLNLSNRAMTMIRNKKGYRNENCYGSGVRDLREIIEYEIVELGNIDIQDTLIILYDYKPLHLLEEDLINEDLINQEIENMIKFIKEFSKFESLEGLWLCAKEEDVKQLYWNEDNDLQTYYLTGNEMIISDIGYDGCLIVCEDIEKLKKEKNNLYHFELISNNNSIKEYKVYDTNNEVGYFKIKFNKENTAYLEMFEVYENKRRKGYGTDIIQKIIKDFDLYELQGMVDINDKENMKNTIHFLMSLNVLWDNMCQICCHIDYCTCDIIHECCINDIEKDDLSFTINKNYLNL